MALLKKGRTASGGDNEESSTADDSAKTNLIDLNDGDPVGGDREGGADSQKITVLEDKIKRLETLLTKCKESIKANKQKTQALTEVKESLSQQLSEKEGECEGLKAQVKDFQTWKTKAQEDELQIAETKMVMHEEIIKKDEEIGRLRKSLKEATDSLDAKEALAQERGDEIAKLKEEQESMEKSLESEKANALQVQYGLLYVFFT